MANETLSAGGIVWRHTAPEVEVLVVERTKNVEPKWKPVLRQLPKGRVELGENLEEAALREVLEETGFTAKIQGKAGVAEWSYVRDGIEWHEVVTYFFMNASSDQGDHDDEFDVVRWMFLSTAARQLSYPEERALLSEVSSSEFPAR